jgi:plasmid maintenance system antidote protein VapI
MAELKLAPISRNIPDPGEILINPFMMKKAPLNKIAEILQKQGGIVKPTDQLLETLGINRARFGRILRNEVKINPLELRAFAKWLGVPESELIGGEK